MLREIGQHIEGIGKKSFDDIKKGSNDPFATLYHAYDMVIKDCTSFPLLVDLLKHRQIKTKTYSDNILSAAMWLRVCGGRNLYDFMCHNLPFPSDSTLRTYISKTEICIEGNYNIPAFVEYVTHHELQNVPFICAEDATRCKKGVRIKIFLISLLLLHILI